jgi:hypothetical protein
MAVGGSVPSECSLEGVASATGGESSAPSDAHPRDPADLPEFQGRTVYALEMAGRNVYCGSARCVSALSTQGWRLSDPGQLAMLVRELATGRATSTHDPSDHFK